MVKESKKMFIAVIVMISLLATMLPSAAFAEADLEGDGSKEDPYLISSEADLKKVQANVEEDPNYSVGKYFELTKNIELEDRWEPIGLSDAKSFQGTFNGRGYAIRNVEMYRNDANSVAGFFGVAKNAKISNLDIQIGTYITGTDSVGGFIGKAMGTTTIESCQVTGNEDAVTGATQIGNYNIGGFVGTVSGTGVVIKECLSTANVKSETTSGSSAIGGFVGRNGSMYDPGGSIDQCYALGNVTAADNVGGFAGEISGSGSKVSNSFAKGDVSATKSSPTAGGFVGYQSYSGATTNCYSVGSVSGTGSSVNGYVGARNSTAKINDCYYDKESSQRDNGAGGTGTAKVTGLTTSEMKNADNFSNWDFTQVWFAENEYPVLRGSVEIIPADEQEKVYDGLKATDIQYHKIKMLVRDNEISGNLSLENDQVDAGQHQIVAGSISAGAANKVSVKEAIYTIRKAPQEAPALALETVSSNMIKVKDIDNAEYSIDKESWQDSSEFSDLDADKEYEIYARLKGNANYEVSPISEALKVKTEIKDEQEDEKEKLIAAAKARKVTKLDLKLEKYNALKVSWGKVSGATGYRVYYKSTTSSKWGYTDITATRLTKKAAAGKKYQVRIKPYTKIDGIKYLGSEHSAKKSIYTMKATAVKLKNKGKNGVVISWKNVPGEKGYQIYRATSKTGKYKKVKTISYKHFKWKDSKAKKGKTYRYKVRAYTKTGKSYIYTPFSKVKTIKK